MQHNLKIEHKWFLAVAGGMKKAEVRRTDRPFSVGDDLMLYVPGADEGVLVRVTHILPLNELPDLACAGDYAVLSIEEPKSMSGEALARQMERGDSG